jgi:hypothetical protein
VIRVAVVIHRWLGVALCPLFLLWFLSGIAMMYADFPAVTDHDRLMRAAGLETSSVVLTPRDAFAVLHSTGSPSAVRLNTVDTRPVYRFDVGSGERIVYADTGSPLTNVSPELMGQIAGRWTGQPLRTATVTAMRDVDQWTVQAPLRTLRPLWKYSWPDGEQVYVAQASGDVVQYTTTRSRIAAYLGPVPHWLYFTPIRTHLRFWTALVTWTSGLGTIGALLGLAIGVRRYSPGKRYSRAGAPTRIPYIGPKWWHMAFGLSAGVAVVTWAFSGMLSMDPFSTPAPPAPRGSADDRPRARVAAALSGPVDVNAFSALPPANALSRLAGLDVKELELVSFAGEPAYLATVAGGGTRVVPLAGQPALAFDRARLLDAIEHAAPHRDELETRLLDGYDAYYFDRRQLRPLPVIVVEFRDPDRTRLYIDPKTARIVGSYSTAEWMSRWAYHGLHSLAFPGLYDRRPLWDVVVLTMLFGGIALSMTAVMLAWRVARGRGTRP